MEEKPSYFAVIPSSVRYDKSVTANAKLLYGEITALCNKEGFCWATNEYFAKLYEVSEVSISKWIKSLADAGHIYVEHCKNGEGKGTKRRIYIVTTQTFGERPLKEKLMRNELPLKQKFMSKNSTSKNNTGNINNDQIEADFEEVWKLYPRKQGKKGAHNAYVKARKSGIEHQAIVKGVRSYSEFIRRNNVAPNYIKQGSTYFNGRCWEDEYDFGKPTVASKPLTALEAGRKLMEGLNGNM